MTTPGIHVAVHTDEALLSTGAWMDFSQHINALVLGGRHEEARVLRGSVFEVVHMEVDPSTPVLQSLDMPPHSTHALLQNPGFSLQFPSIGTWTRKTVFAQEGGTVTSTWDRYHANPLEKLDLLAARIYASGTAVADFIPSTWRSSQTASPWAWTECLRAECSPMEAVAMG